jgi:HPt (histidine-containing phosphotransfer) domain-containing protein
MVTRFLPKGASLAAAGDPAGSPANPSIAAEASPPPAGEQSATAASAAATAAPAAGGRLASTMVGDPKYAKLLERFVSRLPERVSKITGLHHAGDLGGLRQAVHQLRGAGHGYGFASITELAGRAEDLIKSDGSPVAIESEIRALIDLIRQVDGYDRRYENAEFASSTQPISDVAA